MDKTQKIIGYNLYNSEGININFFNTTKKAVKEWAIKNNIKNFNIMGFSYTEIPTTIESIYLPKHKKENEKILGKLVK